MNKQFWWYILLFATAILVQVLFMNHIQFNRFINPFFYVIFLLLLPLNVPRYLLLILGFVLGLTVDVFSNTPGIHASATVFMALIRPYFINSANLEDSEKVMSPTLMNLGFASFVKYAGLLILFHHLFLFYIEIFSFHAFFQTFLRSIFSSLFTFVFVIVSQFLIFRK